jgi:hypothetical protein
VDGMRGPRLVRPSMGATVKICLVVLPVLFCDLSLEHSTTREERKIQQKVWMVLCGHFLASIWPKYVRLQLT